MSNFLRFGILLLLLCPVLASGQQLGCTDPLATNYDADAVQNDGSCVYADTAVMPETSTPLPDALLETSGLILWEGKFLTHNDSPDTTLYSLDLDATNLSTILELPTTPNTDWEEIAQDSAYIYIGDFGNNVSGNRQNLKIFRLGKQSILDGSPVVDSINFSYEGQTDFTPAEPNKTDYDCEAFFVSKDSIYLVTKKWTAGNTDFYRLPKTPGTHVAVLKTSLATEGLVTGATFLEDKRLIALSGYDNSLQPFVYLLYDYAGTAFTGGNKRRLQLGLPFHQVEAITTIDGTTFYLTNEYFSRPPITTRQKLHELDLTDYLSEYLERQKLSFSEEFEPKIKPLIFPNPVKDWVNIILPEITQSSYTFFNTSGKAVLSGKIRTAEQTTLDLSGLRQGLYFLDLGGDYRTSPLIKE